MVCPSSRPGYPARQPMKLDGPQPASSSSRPPPSLPALTHSSSGTSPPCRSHRRGLPSGITLSKETVRHLMTDAGLWIPRRQRPPKIYQPRVRRARLGELVQIDGSDHPWFDQHHHNVKSCTGALPGRKRSGTPRSRSQTSS